MHLHANTKVTITFDLTLTEEEATALNAVTGWGTEHIIKALEQVTGSPAKTHLKGLTSFFGAVREQITPAPRKLGDKTCVLLWR